MTKDERFMYFILPKMGASAFTFAKDILVRKFYILIDKYCQLTQIKFKFYS